MLYRNSNVRTIAPLFTLLTVFVAAGCSHDTRAILAPGDAQISLSTASTLIANQSSQLIVSATKADGSPVSDGTEISLSASAGELESTKVRTKGGEATANYLAAGGGPVEFVATSDQARGQLNVVALSALPAKITIAVSANTVPDGGGEVQVTATVLAANNDPVASAPVEFFATNGSFAPVGPFYTAANGTVTAKLATSQASEVRARVISVESNRIQITVAPPRGKGDQDDLPFRIADLVFLHAPDAKEWDVTSEITNVTFDPPGTSRPTRICFPHTKAGKWKRSGEGEGNVWVIAEVDGTWYAATWDYIRPGQVCKSANGFDWASRRDGIFAHTQKLPLEGRSPRSGDPIGIMVSGFARTTQRTVLERSNIYMTTWP